MAQAFASETQLAAVAQYALLGALLLTGFLALVLSTVWLVCALRPPPPPRSASTLVSGCPTREQSTPERIIDESPTGPSPGLLPLQLPLPGPDSEPSDARARRAAGYPFGASDEAAADTILVASISYTAPDGLNSLAPAQSAQPAAHRRSESSSSTQGSANSMPRCFADLFRALLTLFECVFLKCTTRTFIILVNSGVKGHFSFVICSSTNVFYTRINFISGSIFIHY